MSGSAINCMERRKKKTIYLSALWKLESIHKQNLKETRINKAYTKSLVLCRQPRKKAEAKNEVQSG